LHSAEGGTLHFFVVIRVIVDRVIEIICRDVSFNRDKLVDTIEIQVADRSMSRHCGNNEPLTAEGKWKGSG
jgi:hypothetical protein